MCAIETETCIYEVDMYCMPFLKNREPFHYAWYAWGNVNYTLQRPFHITLNVHACTCLHWLLAAIATKKIHLALLYNEDRTEQLPLQLSRTAEHLQQQKMLHSWWTVSVCSVTVLVSSSVEKLSQLRESQGTHLFFKKWPSFIEPPAKGLWAEVLPHQIHNSLNTLHEQWFDCRLIRFRWRVKNIMVWKVFYKSIQTFYWDISQCG